MDYFAYLGMVTAGVLALIPLYIIKHLLYCAFCAVHLHCWMVAHGTTKRITTKIFIKNLWYLFKDFVLSSPSNLNYSTITGKVWHAPARWLDF